MKTSVRIAAFAAVLAVVVVAAYAIGAVVQPDTDTGEHAPANHAGGSQNMPAGSDSANTSDAGSGDGVQGVSLSDADVMLSPVAAPTTVGTPGDIAFAIQTLTGRPVTDFEVEHDKRLHLIVVRSDGAHFRHVHPTMVADGRWSLPWTWPAAGAYRVFADFTPSATKRPATLTRTVDVAGDYRPEPATQPTTTAAVDGFTATLDGRLLAGESSTMTATVSRNGQPVTALQPYLGAYGHLVALREGDLAYLHAHPGGEPPAPGKTSGPTVEFEVHAPTPGRYLLYLDFKVDDTVRTARFVLDADGGAGGTNQTGRSATPGGPGHQGH
ncbi:hypothetical protein GCM10009624_07860 [Gordonia sinesedis]